MSVSDYDENDSRDNSWIHSRLRKQKQEEMEAKKKALNGQK